MKRIMKISTWVAALAFVALPLTAGAAEDDVADLKKEVKALQKKVEKLEKHARRERRSRSACRKAWPAKSRTAWR